MQQDEAFFKDPPQSVLDSIKGSLDSAWIQQQNLAAHTNFGYTCQCNTTGKITKMYRISTENGIFKLGQCEICRNFRWAKILM